MTEPAHRTDDQGWALRRRREIHDGLRNDLALLRRAVTAAAEADRDVDAAAATLGELSFRRPGWTLRRFCAGFCGAVHGHHATEDRVLFPMLLRRSGTDGALGGAMARLSDQLEAHLRFEEERLAPALNALPRDVSSAEVSAPPRPEASGSPGR